MEHVVDLGFGCQMVFGWNGKGYFWREINSDGDVLMGDSHRPEGGFIDTIDALLFSVACHNGSWEFMTKEIRQELERDRLPKSVDVLSDSDKRIVACALKCLLVNCGKTTAEELGIPFDLVSERVDEVGRKLGLPEGELK
ncbi:MAG: hypothetical protein UT24_C0033G0007 [Candidatus Woesebacteria bacterium GW2011_GWB1_39_12]|uniref:Uncharacterized protein n=1 Tax=Candidatus Woesebacteria bacterium GW2011_GWB1_39_12 TaxID=1618574 RepID=A0A0G0M6J9_9BACT|nr:MAG: hypothetical protein UT24_C0033G0007 [Candidatus Woesebacteria bacterium GW2011_GWB1_39_12]